MPKLGRMCYFIACPTEIAKWIILILFLFAFALMFIAATAFSDADIAATVEVVSVFESYILAHPRAVSVSVLLLLCTLLSVSAVVFLVSCVRSNSNLKRESQTRPGLADQRSIKEEE